jgi:tRNA G18 (ribose-2'-O)-methylase SpoU
MNVDRNKVSHIPKKHKVNGKLVAKIKREKYLRKQQKKIATFEKSQSRLEWVRQHSAFCTWLDEENVKDLRRWLESKTIKSKDPTLAHMKSGDDINAVGGVKRKRNNEETIKDEEHDFSADKEQELSTLFDLVGPYLDLKENVDTDVIGEDSEEERNKRSFIAEGTETSRLMIERSSKCSNTTTRDDSELVSILVKPATFFEEPVQLLSTLQECFPRIFSDKEGHVENEYQPKFQIIIGSEETLTQIVGFHVARGALCCGLAPNRDESWLMQFLTLKCNGDGGIRILALDQISDSANLGSLIRTSAAFGVDVVILSDDSCDVWYRRCVRVSMGHVLTVPTVRVKNLASILKQVYQTWDIASYAAVVDRDAEMVLEEIPRGKIGERWCCVVGNEGNGISSHVIKSCNNKIRIDMVDTVDSLSVGIAAGVLLHGIREREKRG